MIYDYKHCGQVFEVSKPMDECSREETCPICGDVAQRVFIQPCINWGLILTEASHHEWAKDEWVSDKPSNETRVDRSKAPYIKTLY